MALEYIWKKILKYLAIKQGRQLITTTSLGRQSPLIKQNFFSVNIRLVSVILNTASKIPTSQLRI